MKKAAIAVCEKDADYVRSLLNYILEIKENDLEVFGFSKEEEYLRAREKKKFDILLFGEGFFQKSEDYRHTDHAIYLSEGMVYPKEESLPVLYKYQPADSLIRGIYQCMGNVIYRQESQKNFLKDKEMVVIYSPSSQKLQTPFSLATAEALSARKKVLYLNFSICRGFCKCAGIEKKMDMGDLFYLIREGETEFLSKLQGSIYTLGAFSVIPPPENPEHYMEWTGEEVNCFFSWLLKKTDYEVLIVDMGCMIPGFFQILEQCRWIWLLGERENKRDFGIEEMRGLFQKRNEKLNQKVKEIFLSGEQISGEEMYRVEELYVGEMGNCVRELLEEVDQLGDRMDTESYFRRDEFGRGK
ncbi:MAG: hypothetical protein HFI37_01425 [Lachnospiraceae bacterium]|nr:hypothetical protein [Lachnospiraceae bacterium]